MFNIRYYPDMMIFSDSVTAHTMGTGAKTHRLTPTGEARRDQGVECRASKMPLHTIDFVLEDFPPSAA